MANDISIISRLKKIALTSMELGREIAREKTSNALTEFKDSRAGQALENVRQRLNGRPRQPAQPDSKAPHGGKRRLGKQKYSAKAARLTHV